MRRRYGSSPVKLLRFRTAQHSTSSMTKFSASVPLSCLPLVLWQAKDQIGARLRE